MARGKGLGRWRSAPPINAELRVKGDDSGGIAVQEAWLLIHYGCLQWRLHVLLEALRNECYLIAALISFAKYDWNSKHASQMLQDVLFDQDIRSAWPVLS